MTAADAPAGATIPAVPQPRAMPWPEPCHRALIMGDSAQDGWTAGWNATTGVWDFRCFVCGRTDHGVTKAEVPDGQLG